MDMPQVTDQALPPGAVIDSFEIKGVDAQKKSAAAQSLVTRILQPFPPGTSSDTGSSEIQATQSDNR